jgi:hypothetical protein
MGTYRDVTIVMCPGYGTTLSVAPGDMLDERPSICEEPLSLWERCRSVICSGIKCIPNSKMLRCT